MNITEKGIVSLLKSSIIEKTLDLPESFELEQALPLIRQHNIVTLVYAGAVRCGVPRQLPAMSQLFQGYCKAMLISEAQLREISRIYDAFTEYGIDYMPLKGCNMKARYPKPELRVMGDADILIRMEQYEAIKPIMALLAFQPGKETDHELVWSSPSLHLELHKRIIPSYNADFYSYFGDGWKLASLQSGHRYSMSAEAEWIYLFSHFSKHYRDGGIGCRHLVDLWVFLRANPNLDEAYISEELTKLHLLEFHHNIRKVIRVWFEEDASDEISDHITAFIFASGSWGDARSRAISRTVRDSKHTPANRKAVFLKSTLFPNARILSYEYPILKKLPILLPICWALRLLRKALFQRNAVLRGKNNLQAISDEAVAARQQMLDYVGLDYHF